MLSSFSFRCLGTSWEFDLHTTYPSAVHGLGHSPRRRFALLHSVYYSSCGSWNYILGVFAFKSKSTLHIYIEIYYRIIWSDSGSLNIERVHTPHVTVTRFPTASPMRSLPRKSKTFPSCTPCLLGNPRLELCSGRVLVRFKYPLSQFIKGLVYSELPTPLAPHLAFTLCLLRTTFSARYLIDRQTLLGTLHNVQQSFNSTEYESSSGVRGPPKGDPVPCLRSGSPTLAVQLGPSFLHDHAA